MKCGEEVGDDGINISSTINSSSISSLSSTVRYELDCHWPDTWPKLKLEGGVRPIGVLHGCVWLGRRDIGWRMAGEDAVVE